MGPILAIVARSGEIPANSGLKNHRGIASDSIKLRSWLFWVRRLEIFELALKKEGLRLIVPGYTHLQRAQPVLLQHLFLAFVKQLARDAGHLLDFLERMNFCPLGARALAGTILTIDIFMTSEALGFIAP